MIFLQNYLQPWIICLSLPRLSFLFDPVYAAGIEIILNADTLRQLPDTFFAEMSKQSLSTELCGFALHRILESYADAIKKHRNLLFAGSNVNAPQEVRIAAVKFYVRCQLFLEKEHTAHSWIALHCLLSVVNRENFFLYGD